MDGVSRYSRFRSARSSGVLLVALILVLGVGGYVLTSATIRDDRDDAANQRVQVEVVHAQEVLGRARAYVGGLADVLSREPEPREARFARWAGATSASVGLNDVLWVERVPASERERYERLRGVSITRLTPAGRIVPAQAARSYLPATHTSQTRPELRPGVDVSGFPALAAAIRDRARIFAVGASRPGALGTEPGFYLLEAASFARGPGSRGYLVAFVPRGWFSTTLGGDPRRVAISEDGKTIEGSLDSVEASAGFEMLGRNWRIDVAREPPTGLQSTLPWLALAWPVAIAGIALVIGRAITQRRRAQREAERIFEMSLDMIAVGDFEGRFRAVNPAFERTLGYSRDEFLGRPFLDFVHPDDRQPSSEAFADVLSGHELNQFENRFLCKDGSERWLQWSSRAVPHERVIHATARDVTESRRITGEQAALRRAATLVAQAVPLDEVFSAVTQEAGTLIGGDYAGLARFDGNEVVTVAAWAASGSHPPVPPSWQMQEGDPATTIAERRESARWDDWTDVPGAIAEFIRGLGVRSTVGCPIVVEGELWGALAVHSTSDVPLPADADRRINQFNDLVAMAIVNARARGEVARLAQEQAALRRVATLVARDAPQGDVFSSIADSVAELFGTDDISMTRFEGGHARLVVASSGRFRGPFPVGSRQPLGGDNAGTRVFRTGRPVRIDDYRTATGPIADATRSMRIQCVVATPIVVEGRLWGALIVATGGDETLPPETEERLGQFTELMATAIANTESRARAQRLGDEQAGLRRVATLVAEGASPAELLNKVVEELANVLDGADCSMFRDVGDGTAIVEAVSGATLSAGAPVGTRLPVEGSGVIATVLREGRLVRMDDNRAATGAIADRGRGLGIQSAVGCPVVVHGRIWGALGAAAYEREGLPPDAERRIAQFADLASTAIANADARGEVERLAQEQAALRRVATLVAQGVEPASLFAAVTREVARLFADVDPALVPSVIRFDPGPEFVLVGAAKEELEREVGSRYGRKELFVSTRVLRDGASARVDAAELDEVGGPDAEFLRREGFLHQVGSPIVVEGRPWGAITINSANALPPDAAERLEKFTELVATAIAKTESREALAQLVEEQAALRRVATLAAEGGTPSAVLDAVVGEMEALLGADQVALNRFEPGDEILVLAHRGLDVERTPVGSRVSTEGENVTATVRRTGRPARLEDYTSAPGAIAQLARETGLRSSVSAPITVEGHLWGVMTASWKREGSPPWNTEDRMVKFAALVDTAIANAEARTQIERLADEQTALRRVATLVAEGAPAPAVFDAVAAEMAKLLGAHGVTLNRYEAGDEVTVLAHHGSDTQRVPLGTRVSHRGENVATMVRRSKRPARMEHREEMHGTMAKFVHSGAVRASVGAPIVVEGRLWGVATANWRGEERPPSDTEKRMVQFAALLDTAIANADSRAQLAASRARLVTAGDDARRQLVRDLHDGAQQRLVHTIVSLKLAQRAFGQGDGKAETLVGEALQHAERSNAELRELAHGILPAVLTRGGLRAGVDAVVSRLDLPVQVDVPPDRFPSETEASAYFIVAEALTNVMKHSHATRAQVRASVDDGMVRVEVQDDGIGGADPDGHGLVGMADRVTALGGRLTVESPPGNGTLVAATLPLSGT
jgi:PAS domain S-box-containing protein